MKMDRWRCLLQRSIEDRAKSLAQRAGLHVTHYADDPVEVPPPVTCAPIGFAAAEDLLDKGLVDDCNVLGPLAVSEPKSLPAMRGMPRVSK